MPTNISPAAACGASLTYTTRGGYDETVVVPGPLVTDLVATLRGENEVRESIAHLPRTWDSDTSTVAHLVAQVAELRSALDWALRHGAKAWTDDPDDLDRVCVAGHSRHVLDGVVEDDLTEEAPDEVLAAGRRLLGPF